MERIFSFVCGILLVSGVFSSGLDVQEFDKDGAANVDVTETRHGDKETVAISVQLVDIDHDENGKFKDATELKVNVQITVIEGFVHINGAKAHHETVTTFHLEAEIDVIGKNSESIGKHTVPVQIRILVLEKFDSSGALELLIVQEEVVEVSGKKVTQVDVTEAVMRLDDSHHEVNRTYTAVRLAEAEIHKRPQKDDKINYYGKEGMPKKPHLPDHPYHADEKTHKSSLCHSFFKLPFVARLAIFLVVCLIGLVATICCVRAFCCKPASTGEKINLADFDDKFAYDGEFEAPPLDQKVPLEKQKLVIDVEA